jgi:hypothetical protein
MIRQARFQDLPALAAMLREMHGRSKYAGRVAISDKRLEATLLGMIAGQAQCGAGASFCRIAERGNEPVGFMAGLLDPVYHIGDKLTANDVYLYARPGAGSAAARLVRAYVEWAAANPKVVEIKLSWTDALPGAGRIGTLYSRHGFRQAGAIYERRNDGREEWRNDSGTMEEAA